MKKHFALLSLSLLPLFCMSGYAATVIKSLPFTITQPGSYALDKNLTMSVNGAGITVNASSVLIDLKGFSITNASGSEADGIYVPVTSSNVTIQNGAISNFGFNVELDGPEATVQNLRSVNSGDGIVPENTTSCIIQNCFIAGNGSGVGIFLFGCSDVVVKNNQIVNELYGVQSYGEASGGNNWLISNYVGSCTEGFDLFSNDKYQGNVTTLCTTPFTGGIAVGAGNN
jgi:nitrous oxidase accessory protein NosD